VLNGAVLTGAKVAGVISAAASFSIRAYWLDASADGDGSHRVPAAEVTALLGKAGPIEPSDGVTNRRHFGRGDVLRNATLEFAAGAFVEIASLFEQCSISLGKGTELVVGRAGVLSDLSDQGRGKHHHQRSFFREAEPGHHRSRAGRRHRARRALRRPFF
jgi:hypothetical protein